MLKAKLKYLAFKAILFLCLLLPGRFLYWVALRLADLNYLVDKHGREAVKSNLRTILPDAPEVRITYETRWVFRNFGKYLSEFFRFRHFDKNFFDRHVAVRGKEYIDNALEKGNGCILLSAHLSNWELGAAALSYAGYKVNVVTESQAYAKADELFMRERKAMNINAIHVSHAATQVMRALKNNEIVCILGDRDPSLQGIEIDFFGRPCRFPQGPARFAIATGAPIVPGFVLRRTNDSFTLSFEPPITIPEGKSKKDKVREITQEYAHAIEYAIRWHPEEWTVFYSVWDEEWAFDGVSTGHVTGNQKD